MRKTILFGLMAVALAMLPRGARACGRGGYGGYGAVITLALAVGATDSVLTLWDAGSAVVSHRPSVGYGVFETLVSVPQFALGIAGLTQTTNASSYLVGYTLWTGLLSVHGIWTIVASRNAAAAPEEAIREAPPPPKGPQFSLGPTFVPVGQQSHPGFGLSGKF